MAEKPHDPFRPPTEEEDERLETEDEYRARMEAQQRAAGILPQAQQATARRSSGPQLPTLRLALPLVLLLLVVVAWESAMPFWHQSAAPTLKDWDDVVTELKAQRGNRQAAILIAPQWMEPIARKHLGKLMPLRMATLSDVDSFELVLEVSSRGAKHPWLRRYKATKTFRHGALTLRLYQRVADKVRYDFTDRVESAQVTLGPDQVCELQNKRFRCDQRARWNWVGAHLAEVLHRPYRCIYAHPVQGKPLRIRFSKVPLGKTLVIYTGIDDFDNRKKAKGEVKLRVLVGSRAAGNVSHKNDWPWHRLKIDTTKELGKHRKVTFEISSDKGFARTFCFHAEARD